MRKLARRLLALLLIILLGNVGLSLVAAQVATQPPVVADSWPAHGFADTIISPANSLPNYDAARQPKQLWFVPGAGHSEPWCRRPPLRPPRGGLLPPLSALAF